MERNVDKIKRLEHELGRWRKKVADTAKENEKLREALAQADVGNQETQALVDAVLTAVVLEHGERAMDPDAPETALGWRMAVPFFSVKEMREKYEIHARRGEDGKYILGVMEQAINAPRGDISEFAPRIHTIKINPDKIKDVIGKGGSVIRALTEETGTTIEIEDDGTVKIAATDGDKAQHAIRRIEEITAEIEVGRIYNGKVTRIVDFGAFVAIGGGKEGLVHISQIADKRVEKVTDYLQMGQEVPVKVLEVDRQGRVRLSIKEATEQTPSAAAPEAPAAEQGE